MLKSIVICMFFLVNLLANNNNELTSQEKEWIKKNTITVGISPWYPITYTKNGEAKGVGVDMLNQIIKKFHLKVNFKPDNWSNLLNDFKEHKIDLLPTTYYTKQRAKFGNYTTPYMEVKELLYVKSSSKIDGFADLKDKKIAIIKSYGTIEKIKTKFPTIKIIEVDSLDQTVRMLLSNKVDAIFNTQFSVDSFLKNNFISGLKPVFQTDFKPSSLHYFTNKQKPILNNIMQKGVNLLDDEITNHILSKWIQLQKDVKKNKPFLTNEEQTYLHNKKIVRMCNNPNWTPIEFAKNNDMNQMQGIAIDTLKIIENKLQIKFQNVPTKSWSQSQEFLKQKKCDILPCAIETKVRKKYANFTQPYLKLPLAIFTTKDKGVVAGLDEIMDKPWSRQKGSGLITKLRSEYPNMKVVETDGDNNALIAVNNGDVYFTIATLPVASYVISKYMLNDIHIAGYTGMVYNLSIAVRDDDKVLLNILDKTLKQIPKEESKQIMKKWVNNSVKESIIDYKIIRNILIIVSIIIVLFIYRQIILNKANRRLQIKIDEKTKDLQELNLNLEKKIKNEVSKNLKTQEQLFRSEKMASMGEMIGNIAHQWRQPLSTISTASTGMKMQKEYDLLSDDDFIKYCDIINDNVQYLSKTIDDFRNFIKGSREKTKFYIKDQINSCINLIKGSFKTHDIELVIDVKDNIEIFGYENELTQCILNIFNNSKDALIENIENNRLVIISVTPFKDDVVIKIKDNANGINEKIINKIFDPYFTTKQKTQGTGLGLHMTYKLITEGMNGTIKAQNIDFKYKDTNYKGAEFEIKIPNS